MKSALYLEAERERVCRSAGDGVRVEGMPEKMFASTLAIGNAITGKILTEENKFLRYPRPQQNTAIAVGRMA
ncbi:hypothetical protein C7U60_19995 [Mesorhizobium plurifarium]|uniref:hypothetical protein n=1 Tax=Sinorhizobium arboris TaxID=76745 RepID=UPI000488E61C|nr:hypothetical protein [Sinorhizobium arboris]PST17361.1 hypothetical protein C7U60_19995 [Mesorhizobium plurifarium]